MRWGPVLFVLGASTTAALASPPSPRRPPPPPSDLQNPFGDGRLRACSEGKSWPKLRACLEKDHAKVNILHDVDDAKLIALVTEGAASTPLRLYVKEGEQWLQASFFGVDNAASSLLSFRRLGEGRYRIDQGLLMQTSAVVGASGTSQRVWLRRQQTTICTDKTCRTVITACDGMVDGKAYWSFRGTLYEQGRNLFVVGDKSHAGQQCAPSPPVFRSEPIGDPLE